MANQEYNSHLSRKDWNGFLVSAIQTNNPVLAKFAFDNGASISKQALLIAVKSCYPDIFNVIFEYDPTLKDSALKIAIEQNHFHATAWLLVQGAVPTEEHLCLAYNCTDPAIKTLIRSYELK